MKIKVLIGVLIATATPQFLFSQNTFPVNGNVGIGTSVPSERLDVNGNMVVDSSLTVKDSLQVDKDLRTKGRLTVEDKAYFIEKVFMYNKLILSANAEVGNNIKVLNNANIENNANITNNVNVGNKLIVTGTSNLDGNVKMPNLPALAGLGNDDLEIILRTPNGQLKTYGIGDLISLIALDLEPVEVEFCTPEYANNPKWISGLNKLFTVCDEVLVGVGTNNPIHKVHILGTGYAKQLLAGNSLSTSSAIISGFAINNSQPLIELGQKIGGLEQDLRFQVENNGNVIITNNGSEPTLVLNNGSGHAIVLNGSNGEKILQLEDNGLLRSRHVKVNQDNWADYVFSDNYKIMPLSEVEKYIHENKKLPKFPSAKSIKENGQDLGELQNLQMETIEEMYLHMIEMEKQIQSLTEEVNSLKTKK